MGTGRGSFFLGILSDIGDFVRILLLGRDLCSRPKIGQNDPKPAKKAKKHVFFFREK